MYLLGGYSKAIRNRILKMFFYMNWDRDSAKYGTLAVLREAYSSKASFGDHNSVYELKKSFS